MDTHKLSWTNWSFSNSAAESSILKSYITTGEEDGLTIKSETSTAPTEKNSEGFYYWPTEQLKPSAIYVRNLILAAHPAEELPLTITSESSLQSNELTITANAQGGNQKYQYSYYILKDGKIYYQNLLTDHSYSNFPFAVSKGCISYLCIRAGQRRQYCKKLFNRDCLIFLLIILKYFFSITHIFKSSVFYSAKRLLRNTAPIAFI